jgi:hypothetical protein
MGVLCAVLLAVVLGVTVGTARAQVLSEKPATGDIVCETKEGEENLYPELNPVRRKEGRPFVDQGTALSLSLISLLRRPIMGDLPPRLFILRLSVYLFHLTAKAAALYTSVSSTDCFYLWTLWTVRLTLISGTLSM